MNTVEHKMFNNILKTNNIINVYSVLPLLLFPFLISCSSNKDNVIEIITPPKFPKEFSSIPDQTEKPQLIPLISSNERTNEIKSGRENPFLPIQSENRLQIPSSFKYNGQIFSGNTLNAFVSYEDREGTLKIGDIGGENTYLLPIGWTLLDLDTDTKVLTLGFEDRSIDVMLFPKIQH